MIIIIMVIRTTVVRELETLNVVLKDMNMLLLEDLAFVLTDVPEEVIPMEDVSDFENRFYIKLLL